MFDVGFWEVAFIGVIALIVIGPDKLPGVARTVGAWVGKGRRMINEVKADIKKEMNAQDLQDFRDLKSEISSARQSATDMKDSVSDSFGIKEAGEQIKSSMDDVKSGLDGEFEELNSTVGKASGKTSKKKAAKKSNGKKASKKVTGKKTGKQKGKKTAGKKTASKAISKKAAVSKKKAQTRTAAKTKSGAGAKKTASKKVSKKKQTAAKTARKNSKAKSTNTKKT